jgi:hypothetical protein
MKDQLEKELQELEKSFQSGITGMTTNEYCSYYYQLSQKIKREGV